MLAPGLVWQFALSDGARLQSAFRRSDIQVNGAKPQTAGIPDAADHRRALPIPLQPPLRIPALGRSFAIRGAGGKVVIGAIPTVAAATDAGGS